MNQAVCWPLESEYGYSENMNNFKPERKPNSRMILIFFTNAEKNTSFLVTFHTTGLCWSMNVDKMCMAGIGLHLYALLFLHKYA